MDPFSLFLVSASFLAVALILAALPPSRPAKRRNRASGFRRSAIRASRSGFDHCF